MLATDASLVRANPWTSAQPDAATLKALGVSGDPGAATTALGKLGADLIVARTVQAIRTALAAAR